MAEKALIGVVVTIQIPRSYSLLLDEAFRTKLATEVKDTITEKTKLWKYTATRIVEVSWVEGLSGSVGPVISVKVEIASVEKQGTITLEQNALTTLNTHITACLIMGNRQDWLSSSEHPNTVFSKCGNITCMT